MVIIAYHFKSIKISNNMSMYLKQFVSLCSNNRVSPGIYLTPLVCLLLFAYKVFFNQIRFGFAQKTVTLMFNVYIENETSLEQEFGK